MKIGYARVSTELQNPELQTDALAAAGCEKIFTDHASGVTANRPELSRCLDVLRAGDTIVVWRLDRLARSVQDLVRLASRFEADGVDLVSLSEAMDTRTPGGRLLFHLVGAVAEFERALIVERTHAGLAAARARGRVGGRPPALTPAMRDTARRLRDDGAPVAEIAQQLRTSRGTIYRALECQGPSLPPRV